MRQESTARVRHWPRARWRRAGAAVLSGLAMAGSAFCGVLPESVPVQPAEPETERAN